jgi:hypothetical protein
MKYTKIFADEDGETHFTDVEIKLESTIFAPPAPAINLSSYSPATRFAYCVFPSGWFGDWHPPPFKQVFFVLSGTIEVTVGEGEKRIFDSGSIVLVEDTEGKGHRSRVVGPADLHAAVVQLPD